MAATLDTPLARLLHARGLVPLEPLRRALEDVRVERPDGATLAQRLVARGLISPAAAEAALRELGERAPTVAERSGPVVQGPGAGGPWAPGSIVGEHRIVRHLGAGGMGTVFEAEQLATGARRALKTLHAGGDQELRLRFQREAELLARVDGHPNVVRVHSAFVAHGCQVLVMDLLPGGDLLARLTTGPLPPAELVSLGASLADGLAHLHRHGVLHRDLKPHNVMFDERGTPLLVDFGLAHAAGLSLTATGELLGTPAYMAPEQASGDREALGPPLDVYGLAALLFHAATGRPPYVGRSVLDLLAQVATAPPPSAAALVPGFPRALDEALRRGLAKRPADRPATAAAFAASLVEALRAPPRRSRAPRVAAALGGLSLAAVALAALAFAASGLRGQAAPPPDRPASALPEAGPGWRQGWTLAGEAPPSLAPLLLWADAAGREPAPLERLLDGSTGAVEVAFEGKASLRPGGRVRVDYAPPALRAWPLDQGPWSLLAFDSHGYGLVQEAGAARLVAPDDLGGLVACVGESCWRAARVDAELRTLAGSTSLADEVTLSVGFDPFTERASQNVRLRWRAGEARVGAATAWLDRPAPGAWWSVVLAPGAPTGERFKLRGLSPPTVDEELPTLASEGRVALVTLENETLVRALRVEGVPLAVDVPARAVPPLAEPGPEVRVAAGFTLPAGARPLTQEGGPFVAVGQGADELRLELHGWRLLLSQGGVPVATVAVVDSTAPPPALSGWLVLERAQDLVTCRADLGGRGATLALPTPFPRAGAAVPSYGSTGRRAAFTAVTVHVRTPVAPSAEDPRARWRGLATTVRNALLSRTLVGQARAVALRALASGLEQVADELDDEALAADARARALLTRGLVNDPFALREAVHASFTGPGGARARAAFDALVWRRGEPALASSLVTDGLRWLHPSPELGRTLLEVSSVLAPDAPQAQRTLALAERTFAASKVSPEVTALRAEELYREALAQGARPEQVDGGLLDLLRSGERHAEAIPVAQRLIAARPRDARPRLALALALLHTGRWADGLETAIAALVLARRDPEAVTAVNKFISKEHLARDPGRAAMALRAVQLATGITPSAEQKEGVQHYGGLAYTRRDEGSLRSADLAAWAMGQPPAEGDRPTAVLARAGAETSARLRDELRRAAQADPLVAALTAIDPSLCDLVR